MIINENKIKLPSEEQNKNVFLSVDENFNFLDHILGKDIGLIKSKYDFLQGKTQIGIVYINYLANQELISNQIIKPLLQADTDILKTSGDSSIISKIIYLPDKRQCGNMEQVIDDIYSGYCKCIGNSKQKGRETLHRAAG